MIGNKIWRTINPLLGWAGVFCSIASIIFLIFNETVCAFIALGVLCIMLICLLWRIVVVLNHFLEKPTEDKHKCIASFIKYKCPDGENVYFETYKLIQAKCSVLHFFDLGLKWSGTRQLEVESSLQDIENFRINNSNTEYDNVILRLKRPVLYNENTVIHCKTHVNDADHRSDPKVEVCVKSPTELINTTIELSFKERNTPARCMKKRIESIVPQNYQLFDSIPFNEKTRQYEYSLINPDPGYFYKIEWDR